MHRTTIGLFAPVLLAGCVHNSNLDQVRAGMPRERVVSIMGQPDSSTNTPGRECATYSVMKDFWSRVPWEMTSRYYVCYVDGKVDTFGKVEQPEPTAQKKPGDTR